jgi:uncharacterized protein
MIYTIRLSLACILCALAVYTQAQKHDAEIIVETLDEKGLHGKFFYPKGGENLPPVIIIGGSEGGIWLSETFGYPLAQEGFAALALPYWQYADLPDALKAIPLEYFDRAIDWVHNQPATKKEGVAMIGNSRGGEGALLIASHNPKVSAVVGAVPGDHVAPSIDWDDWTNRTSAWTLNGDTLAYTSGTRYNEETGWGDYFEKLGEQKDYEEAAIKVEHINGPVMLISGGDDKIWPSQIMSDRMIERLRTYDFPYFNCHINFPEAGHKFVTPPRSYRKSTGNRSDEGSKRKRYNIDFGGTPEANDRAQEEAWLHILNFLKVHYARDSAAR